MSEPSSFSPNVRNWVLALPRGGVPVGAEVAHQLLSSLAMRVRQLDRQYYG